MRDHILSIAVIASSSFLTFGNFYSYDVPASISDPLRKYLDLSMDDFSGMSNAFYSVYSIPNVILPFFGGALIDSVGLNKMTLLCSGLVCLGNLVFCLGIQYKMTYLSLIGRCILGVGGETLGVTQSSVVAQWFGHNRVFPNANFLALAMGFNLSVGRLGSVVNDFISPRLAAGPGGVLSAVYAGFACCLMSLIAAIVIVWLNETYPTKAIELVAQNDELNQLEIELFDPDIRSNKTNNCSHVIFLLGQLPFSYWLTCIVMILTYGTVIPFNAIHSTLLQTKFQMSFLSAAEIMAIPDTISMILTPVTGYIADRYGHRMHMILICGLGLTFIHASIAFAPVGTSATFFMPYFALFIMGLCYSFLLLLWPVLTLLTPQNSLSISYGISTCILNLSGVIFPTVVSTLVMYDPSFFAVEILFAGCAATSVILSLLLISLDSERHGNILRDR